MLLQFKVHTSSTPDGVQVHFPNQNLTLALEKVSKSKFQREALINGDEIIQYIIGDTIVSERSLKFEQDSFIIIQDTLQEMKIVRGFKQITFILDKYTVWPHMPFVCGSLPELGNWCPEHAQMMSLEYNKWHLTISVSKSFEYKFITCKMLGNEIQWEVTPNRKYCILNSPECVEVEAQWEGEVRSKKLKRNPKFVHISINYKTNSPQEKLVVVGNIPALGMWNPSRGKVMQRQVDYNWHLGLMVDESEFQYKFVVVVNVDNNIWEQGDNRGLELENRQFYDIAAYWNYQNKSRVSQREYDIDCPICSQYMKESTIRIGQLCGHLICSKCYSVMSTNTYQRVKCPICRKAFLI